MRRTLLAGFAALAAFVLAPTDAPLQVPSAEAAVSVQVSVEELARQSAAVIVGKALERTSTWEELAGGRRIVTYTRVAVEETIVGSQTNEVMVRTLGGAVGRVGQQVSGEATLVLGQRAVLFLTDDGPVKVVTAMAQGHYPLIENGGEVRLSASADAGTVLPRRGPAISALEELVGLPLGRAEDRVRAAFAATHAQGTP